MQNRLSYSISSFYFSKSHTFTKVVEEFYFCLLTNVGRRSTSLDHVEGRRNLSM